MIHKLQIFFEVSFLVDLSRRIAPTSAPKWVFICLVLERPFISVLIGVEHYRLTSQNMARSEIYNRVSFEAGRGLSLGVKERT